jgi:hypothetical protein
MAAGGRKPLPDILNAMGDVGTDVDAPRTCERWFVGFIMGDGRDLAGMER